MHYNEQWRNGQGEPGVSYTYICFLLYILCFLQTGQATNTHTVWILLFKSKKKEKKKKSSVT